MNNIWIQAETVKDKLAALAHLSILTKKPISSSATADINNKNITLVGIDVDGRANLFYWGDSVKKISVDELLTLQTLEELNTYCKPKPQLKLGSKFLLNDLPNTRLELSVIRMGVLHKRFFTIIGNNTNTLYDSPDLYFDDLEKLNVYMYKHYPNLKILN